MATYNRKDYEESEAVKQQKAAYDQHQSAKPGEYQSQYQQIADDTLKQYMNRDKFSYDLNGDAMYQQYKNKYTQQGKMAMMDTMGQAQAMTGGYGNSYAQAVGQQAYQSQLQNLNDIVPELYQLAYDRYNQEGQDLQNKYAMAANRESQDYSRHQDKMAQWNTENDRLYGQYLDERNFDYGRHVDDRNFGYQQDRDAIADQQWQQSFDENKRVNDRNYEYQVGRDQVADQQWQQSFDEGVRQYDQNFGYQQDRDAVADGQWREAFDYQQDRDKVGDEQWATQMEHQKGQDKLAQENWQKEFDFAKEQYKANLDSNAGDTDFERFTFSRVDDNGNYVYYKDGKEYTYAAGVNPYTGSTNPDTKHGTFSNGYQPNNIGGKPLEKSGATDVVNGTTQNIWNTPDGNLWIWDGTKNAYQKYTDEKGKQLTVADLGLPGSQKVGGGGGTPSRPLAVSILDREALRM